MNSKLINAKLINAFSELLEISNIMGNAYRESAYRRAITELRRLDFEITKANLDSFARRKTPGIGSGIMVKIREFITTGKIAELEKLRDSREVKAYRDFSKILGVGPSTVRKWVQGRVDTLPKLRKAIGEEKIVLNHMQKLGLKYYDDLNTRIPRAEVTQLGNMIRAILLTLDPNVIFEIAGSYRRGKMDSGDIDILVSNANHFDEDLLPAFISVLNDDPNYVDVVTAGKERVTVLFKSPVSGRVRQIDILNIAYGSYYAALNYFTGGFVHNAWLRGIAKKQGYRLNQAGLFKYVGNKKDKLQLCPIHSEEELYKILGVGYVLPANRE